MLWEVVALLHETCHYYSNHLCFEACTYTSQQVTIMSSTHSKALRTGGNVVFVSKPNNWRICLRCKNRSVKLCMSAQPPVDCKEKVFVYVYVCNVCMYNEFQCNTT